MSTQHRAVVGAARRINLGRRIEIERLRRRKTNTWQPIAWRHYDIVPEVHYAFNYLANTLSRVRIYGAYMADDRDGAPTPIGSIGGVDRDLVAATRYEIAKLDTAHGGQPGLIRQYALNRLVAGDMYLAEVSDKLGIYSTQEVEILGPTSKNESSGVRLKTQRYIGEQDWIDLPKDAFIARIWCPHPAWTDEADSSMLAVQESCEDLITLSRSIRAAARSQINAGILYVADELTFERASDVQSTADSDDPDNPDEGEGDAFEEELTLAMTEPISDDSSPSSVTPMLVRGPAELASTSIVKIDLSRKFDEQAPKLRDDALSRVLNGIDIPKDLVTGMANVRYSNAQQISEELYKAHVEPAAVDFCEAYTVTRLRPALLARGFSVDQVARVTTWYDASEVTVSANRSEDADKGHDRILISDATWRRDHGYTDDDAPDDEEYTRRLAQKSTFAPETAIQLMAALMPLISDMARAGQVVLQPSSMQPQRPPHLAAVQNATIPGEITPGPATAQPVAPNGPAAPQPAAGQGAAGGSDATPPPGGSLPPAVAASAAKPAALVAEREIKQLLAIERNLRTSLQTMLTDMTERALEKAGSRLSSKLRGDAVATAKIKDVPKTMVAAVLGREAVLAAGYTDQQLASDSVDQAEAKYLQQVKQAQTQAARVLGTTSTALFNGDHASASWSVLKPLLIAFVVKSLFRQEDKGYLPKVPMDSVRLALARAGGGQPKRPTLDGYQHGAVLNPTTVEALASKFDADTAGYRWVYGISDNHFEPHVKLDGVEFADWKDPALQNSGSFPRAEYLYPGDHTGCECDAMPALVARQPHEGRVLEHVGEIG